jgi:AraC family transcriptional regulator
LEPTITEAQLHDGQQTLTVAHAHGRAALARRGSLGYRPGLPGCRLRRVLDHVRDHLVDDLSVARLAAVAAMSPHHFSALFKNSTGFTPHRYVVMQRIECAKQRLEDLRSSVLVAAMDSGFENPSHFARTFRRIVGTSPSEYRADMLSRRCDERHRACRVDLGPQGAQASVSRMP